MDIKTYIGNLINIKDLDFDFTSLVSEVVDKQNGDYCLPCFSLAKIMKKSPVQIAEEIKANFPTDKLISKIEVVNGYVNFFLNKAEYSKIILNEINSEKIFEPNSEFINKVACVEYSSVNLAKYMHIGHLSTTIIGESLARINEALGFKVVRINYIGDYGTPFGKMVYAYLNWGSEEELEKNGIDCLQGLYVDFCKRAETDTELEEKAREYFKLIDEKDSKVYPVYQKFIEISKQEAKNLLDKLDVHFDSWKGESAYSDELSNVLKMLDDKKLLTSSEGAKIVDLEQYNLGKCLIQKSDGTSLYASRDIAAAIDRFNTYKFDKMLYVTAVQQKLHFQQFFKVLELLGFDFAKTLTHVYYGMFSLPNGKIASRKGKQAVLKDLMEYSYNKAYQMVENRNFDESKKQEIANKIANSALKFNAIKNERIKDTVFDIENAFSFEGDTSAYIQYTYTRISSIIKKANIKIDINKVDYSFLNSDVAFNLVLMANNYPELLLKAMQQNEPSILSKYLLELCKQINKFYTSEKVVTENEQSTHTKLYLLENLKKLLTKLFHLVIIETVEEM